MFFLACGAFGVCKLQLFWLLVIVLALFWLMVIVLAIAIDLGDCSGSCICSWSFWLLQFVLALGSWLLDLFMVILAFGCRSW